MLAEQLVSSPGLLSVLHAPAGFGKSTLLTHVRESLEQRGAAVSHVLDVGTGDAPSPWILLDEPAASTLDSDALREALDRAVTSKVGIIIATRHIERLPLARLRADERSVRLGSHQIGISHREAVAAFKKALAKRDAEWLAGLIGGWTVSIPFLVAHARDRDARFDKDGDFLDASGLSAYINEELLADLPVDWVSALRFASIVSTCDRAMLDAIRPDDDLGRHLVSLRRHLPGLVDDRAGETWINPLLRMHLMRQFEQLPRTVRAEALERASVDCARKGREVEAANLIMRVGDADAIAAFVRRSQGLLLWTTAGFDVIRDIVIQADLHGIEEPRLKLLKCTVLMKDGQIAKCERLLENVMPLLAGDEDALRDADEVRATLAIYGCRTVTDEDIARFRQNIFRYGDAAPWKTLILLMQCILSIQRGDLDDASAFIVEAAKQARASGSDYNLLFLDIHATNLALARGDLQRARILLGQARKAWRQKFSSDVGVHTILDALTTSLEFEAGRLSSARVHIRRSTHHMPHVEAWLDIYAAVYEPMARILCLDIGLPATLVSLSAQREALDASGLPRVTRLVSGLEACLRGEALLRAEPGESLGAVPGPDAPTTLWSWQERELFGMAEAYLHLSEGRPDSAAEVLRALIGFAQPRGLFRSCLRAKLLMVAALDRSGDEDGADRTFEKTLLLGERTGMSRVFAEIGGEAVRRRVARSLTAWHNDGTGNPRRIKLLRTLARWGEVAQLPTTPRLTPREADVLAALEQGGIDKLIGRRLGVSEHAVRYHLKNIYRKLGVHDRVGALSRARDAGLLA